MIEGFLLGIAVVLIPEMGAAGIVLWRLRQKHRRETLAFMLRLEELWERRQAQR